MEDKVLIRMDEAGHEGISPEEIMPILKDHLLDAVNRWLKQCRQKHLTGTPLRGIQKGEYSYFILPEDYLRLVEMKCKEWETSAIKTEGLEHPKYKLEKNRYLRSTRKWPFVFEGKMEAEGRIEHALMARGSFEYAYYQKRIARETLNTIDQDVASWYVAGELFEIFGDTNKAQTCYQKSDVL